ncbi:UNVERIFIED_CONTAM: hypothetical protein GTU68_057452 [Idotea baltica]|nr:hypothetical protein [Idotea baltica]
MDKTTNHLESLAWLARDADEKATWLKFRSIRDFHHDIMEKLFPTDDTEIQNKIGQYFAQIEKIIRGILLLGEFPDPTYDRIVSFGELLSTTILNHYLHQEGLSSAWIDAREVIKTDSTHTQATVVWSLTRENIEKQVKPLLKEKGIVVTQGFIGSSLENKVTTLGREGSDYTGSIFAASLEAESLTVWKDVRGILSGDPRIEEKTSKIDALSYERAVELTFYGASVIHPKTIKPLRNAGIPLYVKCFLDTSETGTVIERTEIQSLPVGICSRVRKKNQAILHIKPKDFSFMEGNLLGKVFGQVARAGIQVNLIQASAISLSLCVDNVPAAIEEFNSLLLDDFLLECQGGMVLRTYIDYTVAEADATKHAVMSQVTEGKLLVVEIAS